jgi:hypothetical protein
MNTGSITEASTAVIASALGITPRAVRKRAETERWAYRDRDGKKQWDVIALPRDVQVQLTKVSVKTNAGQEMPDAIFNRVGDKNRTRARYRIVMVNEFLASGLRVEDFVTAFQQGLILKPLWRQAKNLSARTLYRWVRDYRDGGRDGIVPKWGLGSRPGSSLTDIEKGNLEYWYLTPNRWSAMHCWRALLREIPTSQAQYQTALRYLKSLPKPLVDYHRQGRTKFDSLYQPYIDRDPALYAPMEQVVSDHHCFDFLVIKDGVVFRPWITLFQDYRSAKIVGIWVSVYPSSLSIMAAFYRMVAEYGAPGLIHIDNGKDYRSKAINGKTKKVKILNESGVEEEELVHLQGAFGLLGCQVTFSKPYHGQSKGRTERTFGSFAEYFSKSTGTYIGSNTVARHEDTQLFYRAINGKAKRNDLYAWDDFVRGIEAFIPWWNAHWRGEGKGLGGMTPDEVFYANRKEPRTVDPQTLLLIVTKAEIRLVRENGVFIGGVHYWAEELIEHAGRKVMVRLPVVNPNTALIMDLQGHPLCTARANWFEESGDLSADNERVNRARKSNLEKLKKMGVGKMAPSKSAEIFIAIAEKEMGGGLQALPLPPGFGGPEPEAVPQAAGAETRPAERPKYISPLDIGVVS